MALVSEGPDRTEWPKGVFEGCTGGKNSLHDDGGLERVFRGRWRNGTARRAHVVKPGYQSQGLPPVMLDLGERAERAACRLVCAMIPVFDYEPPSYVIDALRRLPSDLSDIPDRPRIVLELLRREGPLDVNKIMLKLKAQGVDTMRDGYGVWLVECLRDMSSNACGNVQEITEFQRYCRRLRNCREQYRRALAGA